MNANNKYLRKYYLNLRENLPKDIRKQKDELILDYVKSYLKKNIFKRKIGIYFSIKSEVNTHPIITWLLSKHYHVYIPKIIDTKNCLMEFTRIYTLDFENELVSGIKQTLQRKFIEPKELDVIFVPLLTFDKNLYRIGYGKGYYDRFLKRTYAKKIGLAYQIQQHYSIQHDENDVKLDLVITENGAN